MNNAKAIEGIYKSALKFLLPLDSQETYRTIVEEAMTLARAEVGAIYLENNGNLEPVYNIPRGERPQNARKRGYTKKAVSTKEPVIVSKDEVIKVHREAEKFDFNYCIFVPLSYNNKSIGTVNLFSKIRKSFFNRQRLETFKLFGSMASLAIIKTKLYAQTREALEERDLFISIAAHEIRTPLTVVNLYSQLLEKRLESGQPLDIEWGHQIRKAASRITNLVNEFLNVDQIKSNTFPIVFRECKLKTVVGQAVRDFRLGNQKREIIVEDEIGESSDLIKGDYEKLLQVMNNLLENASKFSPADSKIEVNIKAVDSKLVVSVKDQGRGISKREINQIFGKFYKSNKNSKDGMGLGLFLSKEIVEKHNGTININSEVNRGTTAEICLPCLETKDARES